MMKSRLILVELIAALVCTVLVLAGCDGGVFSSSASGTCLEWNGGECVKSEEGAEDE